MVISYLPEQSTRTPTTETTITLVLLQSSTDTKVQSGWDWLNYSQTGIERQHINIEILIFPKIRYVNFTQEKKQSGVPVQSIDNKSVFYKRERKKETFFDILRLRSNPRYTF